MTERTVRLAVLLSGSGRTLQNFLERQAAGDWPLQVCAVVSSRGDVRGVEVARGAGLPVETFRRKDHASVAEHNQAINDWLRPHAPEIIALAGYLCLYRLPDWLDGPVVNIHPALLPKYGGKGFYGDRVHRAVLAAEEKESGCTVHLVNDQYDDGQILEQARVPVLPNDDEHSLAARVFRAECDLYPRVLANLAEDLRQ
jgi:phosphoribosylglycinamide formyltransferase-1